MDLRVIAGGFWRRGFLAVLILSGCAASFQPFGPAVTKEEINAALKQRDDNIQLLAQAIKELVAKAPKEVKRPARPMMNEEAGSK